MSLAAHAADCPPAIELKVPASACRFGTAVVAVDPIPGASYSWSIDGASFADGLGTERVVVALGGADTVKIDVDVATPGCVRHGSGIIAVREAFLIAHVDPGVGFIGQPRTITWSYANGTPSEQILSGTDLAPITLPNDLRSYSYIPTSEGQKSVVIQARSGPLPTGGRQRAAGRGTAAASDCNVARAVAAYRIECTTPDATITAPSSTNIESSFIARVDLITGATAKWTIVNGTPATATGESVSIKPNGSAPVDVNVVVSAGSCTATGKKRVAVDGTLTCDNPTVDVAVLENDCGGTVVQARFTGKPPYSGTWNDGVTFSTSDRAIQRSVGAGTFSVTTFSDGICAGQKSNSVAVTPKIATVTFTAPGGLCAGTNQVVATFAGTPPFSGTWYDGTTFTTSSTQITKTVTKGGPIYMDFRDAVCPTKTSPIIVFIEPPTVQVSISNSSPSVCTGGVTMNADVIGAVPPITLTWSDGYVQTTNAPQSHFTHGLSVAPGSATYGVASAHDHLCALKVSPPLAVTGTSFAYFNTSSSYCPGQQPTATLSNNPGAGATIVWSITNGTILSGQGTPAITYSGAPGTAGSLSCQVTNSVGCTDTRNMNITFVGTPAVPQVSISPSGSVTVGATVSLSWTADNNSSSTTIVASTPGNQPTPANCFNKLCSAVYTAKTAGTVVFTVHAYPRCGGNPVDGTAQLTVTP